METPLAAGPDLDRDLKRTPPDAKSMALKCWIRALDYSRILQDRPTATLVSLVDELAETHGARPALLGEGEPLSYRDLATRSNRYARWAVAQGLTSGEVVCLLVPNCPDYVAIWLGLTRAGCVVALINTNLASGSLLQCIEAAGSVHVIVGAHLLAAVIAIAHRLRKDVRVWTHGQTNSAVWPPIEPDLLRHSGARLDATERPFPQPSDRALLIYTSGTTGVPKAANITHRRIVEWSFWFAGMMDAQPSDRLYNCLPMYHSIGGIVAIGAMLVKGGSVVIRARFSASRFWDDVVDAECTIFQYIGELCRYLLRGPAHPRERLHRLRLACGNGLSGDIWTTFQGRFGIPRILEYYAATEGIVSLYNAEIRIAGGPREARSPHARRVETARIKGARAL